MEKLTVAEFRQCIVDGFTQCPMDRFFLPYENRYIERWYDPESDSWLDRDVAVERGIKRVR